MHEHDNVILFPKWKVILEEESLVALKEKRYDEALKKLNKLLDYHVNNHEIIIGKLICLMELAYYDEAQDLCEELLVQKDENYFQYVHIYLTLLFQTSQYNLLLEQVDYEFQTEKVPSPYREQFEQLYDMSQKMNDQLKDEKMMKYINEFVQAIEDQDHMKQWRLVENMRNIKAQPKQKMIVPLLTDDTIHPVTKTAIFQWLQEMNIAQSFDIHKLGLQLTVNPVDIAELNIHTMVKQTFLLIIELEQTNPTLFHLLEKILHQYAYVRYPIMPPGGDAAAIADALITIGEQYLNLPDKNEVKNDKTLHYIEEIKMCEALYLSIIDE
ncbi:tetratricopeptide repeat protein [Lentibacillus sp. Marseille-P4043]|uniref:tetratricopeptide repeat protein n=1 Tax=Lentibacillus sp. Marseille-P4043 TaxID=2040293 RepID=UPI000D0B70E1|nr:tetratricopeptide repeat protein [Lentibacillus sp. Marseille-P4043]